jgi:hypothetical protein
MIKMALLLLTGLIACSNTSAQITGQERSLNNLRQVKVIVTATNMNDIGLSEDVITTDVELRLRKAGVPVLSLRAEWPPESPRVTLVVHVITARDKARGQEILACAASVQLLRTMQGILVSTWQNEAVGLFETSLARSGIREGIADSVDKFANDYLAANPKSQP